MATRQEMIAFIRQNPGCKNTDVANHFGFTVNSAATRTKQLIDGGYATRKNAGLNSRKTPVWAYWAIEDTEGKTKQERIVVAQLPKPKAHDVPIVSQSLDDLVGAFVSSFAASLATAIVGQLKPRLEEELKKALPAALPSPTYPTNLTAPSEPVHIPADKERLPRVGIMGLAPSKRSAIDAEFGTIFDLKYWWSEDGDNKLKPLAHSCETIFVMDYVSHKHTQLLQSRGANLRRVNGDIRALTDLLTGYFLEKAA